MKSTTVLGLCYNSKVISPMPLKDPKKRREYDLTYRKKWLLNPLNKLKAYALVKKSRERKESKYYEYKKTLKCAHCSMKFNEHPECCDFHHVNHDRTLMKDKKSFRSFMHDHDDESLQKALKDCIPLCANCHRILTAREIKNKKNLKSNNSGVV